MNVIERIEVCGGGQRVVVDLVGRDPIEVAAIWLRDACHCATCRRPATNERRLDPTSIDPAIRALGMPGVRGVDRADGDLVAEMSDGHRVVVPAGHVTRAEVARQAPSATGSVRGPARADRIERFDAATPDTATLDTGLLAVLDALDRDGAVLVHGVEPSTDGLRGVADRIGPIHATNYGVTWEIDAVLDPVSEVESDRALLVHTDLPYRTDPPGVQLLLACDIETAGGATTLVDGFACALTLQSESPEAFELLTSVQVEYPYVRDDVEIIGRAPLIEVGGGELRMIRRAPDLMGSPLVHADDADAFYEALRRWWHLLDEPAISHEIRLAPGDLLLFDNHRMLHGRTAFELGASGRRRIIGCYLHADDVTSRHAVLRRTTSQLGSDPR